MTLDATNVKDETGVQAGNWPVEGIYHFVVNTCDDSMDKMNGQTFELEVLAGKPADQKGRKFQHAIFLDDDGKYTEKHLRFALASGVIKPGEKKDPNWQDAVGRQVVAAVEYHESQKTGKSYPRIANYGMDVWSVGHEEVKDVPKDEAAVKLLASGNASGGDEWDL